MKVSPRWRFRLAGGLGWTEKTWSPADSDSRQGVVIGSHLNGAVQIGFHRPAWPQSSKKWHQVGVHLTLDHQSNASFTQPNLGTNVVRFGLSTAWKGRVPASKAMRESGEGMEDILILPAPVNGWQFQLALGRRQPGPLEPRETTSEIAVDYRLSLIHI